MSKAKEDANIKALDRATEGLVLATKIHDDCRGAGCPPPTGFSDLCTIVSLSRSFYTRADSPAKQFFSTRLAFSIVEIRTARRGCLAVTGVDLILPLDRCTPMMDTSGGKKFW